MHRQQQHSLGLRIKCILHSTIHSSVYVVVVIVRSPSPISFVVVVSALMMKGQPGVSRSTTGFTWTKSRERTYRHGHLDERLLEYLLLNDDLTRPTHTHAVTIPVGAHILSGLHWGQRKSIFFQNLCLSYFFFLFLSLAALLSNDIMCHCHRGHCRHPSSHMH